MKPNSGKDFWRYMKVNNGVIESYCVDETFRGKWSTVQYLIEKYKMSDDEAYKYVNNMKHI